MKWSFGKVPSIEQREKFCTKTADFRYVVYHIMVVQRGKLVKELTLKMFRYSLSVCFMISRKCFVSAFFKIFTLNIFLLYQNINQILKASKRNILNILLKFHSKGHSNNHLDKQGVRGFMKYPHHLINLSK